MFLSRIWFFIVAVIAILGITAALVMPRPAERASAASGQRDLERACSVAQILLVDNARVRVQLAGDFAVRGGLGALSMSASRSASVTPEVHSKSKAALSKILDAVKGDGKPSFVILADRKGRVLARRGIDEGIYGDMIAGYPIVDDALSGYLRDDLWYYRTIKGAKRGRTLYRVAAAPVFEQLDWAGVVILGHAVDKSFAEKLGTKLQTQISFYVNKDTVASNSSLPIHDEIISLRKEAKKDPSENECSATPITVGAGEQEFHVLTRTLPGEAGQRGAFFAVAIPTVKQAGLMGTLNTIKKEDMSFSNFPWIMVALLFLVLAGVGMAFMLIEVERPMKRLAADSVALSQAEGLGRLDESRHKGKLGSIARSINIAIDKMNRETKAAKRDLDQLMGPGAAPAAALPGGLGVDAAAPALPPPPSEFKFSDALPAPPPPPPPMSGDSDFSLGGVPNSAEPQAALGLSMPSASPASPPSLPPLPAEPAEQTQILDPTPELLEAAGKDDDTYFREVFDDFLALKTKCGEPTHKLTFEKFARKLRANREALIAKHGCKSVKFQVYIKDGKAALKASPVRA